MIDLPFRPGRERFGLHQSHNGQWERDVCWKRGADTRRRRWRHPRRAGQTKAKDGHHVGDILCKNVFNLPLQTLSIGDIKQLSTTNWFYQFCASVCPAYVYLSLCWHKWKPQLDWLPRGSPFAFFLLEGQFSLYHLTPSHDRSLTGYVTLTRRWWMGAESTWEKLVAMSSITWRGTATRWVICDTFSSCSSVSQLTQALPFHFKHLV